MTPQINNVYGQLVAPDGLRAVLKSVEEALGPGAASVYRSGSKGGDTLRVRTDTADLESIPLPGGLEYLLNGAVGGTADEVLAFVRTLSGALAAAKVEHSFDVHDVARQLRATIP